MGRLGNGQRGAAEKALQTAPVAKVADPRSTTALAVYLGALDFAVTPEALTQWLTLVYGAAMRVLIQIVAL